MPGMSTTLPVLRESREMDQASHFAVEALNAARRWTYARVLLRKTLDSKSASPSQIEKAKVEYNKAAEELEKLVLRLERLIRGNGKQVPANRRVPTAPFPWRELFGMVAAGAKAVENALDPAMPPIKGRVIDVEPE